MKKVLAWILSLILLFGTNVLAETKTVSGEAMGMLDVLGVEVDFEGEAILDVRVTFCKDTATIKDAAIASLPRRIVEQQNIEVDVVAGATMTSFGIRNAVAKAIENAGLDVKNYRKGSDAVKEKVEKESESYDIVIVGAGLAGVSAALQARRSGIEKVLILEKEAYAGGSSLVCGGGIWVANTKLNEEIGVNFTEEELIAFLKKRSDNKELNEALLKNMYKTIGDTAGYITENGLPYTLDTWSLGHPDSNLPVLWSKNDCEHPWKTGKSGYFDAVADMVLKEGAELRVNSKVSALLYEGNTVTGVRVEDLSNTYNVQAKKVILATGGFTRNSAMVEEYAPDFVKAFPMTGPGSTGDGITMTKELGAQVIGEGMMGLMGVNMNYGYYGPIGSLVWSTKSVVNKEGKEFGMDKAFYSETLDLLLKQTDSQGIGIFDNSTKLTERLDLAVSANVAKKFSTLEELAIEYGIDSATLASTAEEKQFAEGPYYAMPIRPLFIGSIPGLQVDEDCRVLNAEGKAIENLLAAGELIFGNMFQVRYPSSGTGMGLSAYTGTLAALTAIEDMGK